MDFSKEIVVVTGSSRGIGKAIAYDFAKKGAKVILNGAHDKKGLITTYNSFVAQNLLVAYYFGDVSVYTEAQHLFSHTYNTYGSYPTILINNAGISHIGLFTKTPPEVWQHVLTTNLNSVYNCSFIAAPHMISKRSGVIINISSIWGDRGASCEVAYSTSKSAINGFTKSLAKELGPSNIRVNAVSCGWIETAMNNTFSLEEQEVFKENISLCKFGLPSDVSNTCMYLASDLSAYLTGQIITLDGGML